MGVWAGLVEAIWLNHRVGNEARARRVLVPVLAPLDVDRSGARAGPRLNAAAPKLRLSAWQVALSTRELDETNARALVEALAGEVVLTTTQRRENRILGVDGDNALVATGRAPDGERVLLSEIQAALDRLAAGEIVEVNPDSRGYRSSFIGAL